jgi:hypothetical protein
MAENCQKCGRNLALVGRTHNCVVNTIDVVNTPIRTVVNEMCPAGVRHEDASSKKAAKGTTAGKPPAGTDQTLAPPGRPYPNTEKRRAYMKSYMAKRRKGSQTGPMA